MQADIFIMCVCVEEGRWIYSLEFEVQGHRNVMRSSVHYFVTAGRQAGRQADWQTKESEEGSKIDRNGHLVARVREEVEKEKEKVVEEEE